MNITWKKYGTSVYTTLTVNGSPWYSFSYIERCDGAGWSAFSHLGQIHGMSSEAEAQAWVESMYMIAKANE